MKPLIAIALIVIIAFAASSCKTQQAQDADSDKALEESVKNALSNERGYELDVSQLETEQKFRKYMQEGETNLAKCNRLENMEQALLKYETDSENMRRVLDMQDHYLQNALDCFSQALLIHSNSYAAHQGVAIAAAKLDKYDLAIEHGTIVLNGSESRVLIYRVLLHAYQRKAAAAQTSAEKVQYLRKAEALADKYRSLEPEPDIHLITYVLAQIHAVIAENLAGDERLAEYKKAAAVIDQHLEKYPDLINNENPGLAEFAQKMKAASTRYKNAQ